MHIEATLSRLALSLLDQDQLDAMIFVMTKAPPDFAIRKVSTEPMELREKFKENYEALRKTASVPDIAEMWDTEGIEGIVALAAEKGFVKFEDIMNAKKAIYPAFSHTSRFQSSVISWFLLLGRDSRRPSVFQFAGLSWSLLLGRDLQEQKRKLPRVATRGARQRGHQSRQPAAALVCHWSSK